jgi:serine/threonine protein kinase
VLDNSEERPARASADLQPGARLGPYRVEGTLGEGGLGVVYLAVRDPDGQAVALKLLRPELSADETYRRRFEREGEIASGLSHEHLVPVLDRGTLEGRYFLATRYVRGPSLAERIAEGPLAAEEIVRVVSHVGSGLDAIHGHGLVHRDVKPANVILDEKGRAALTDFGVARSEAHTVLTKHGQVVGTVDYLAPEVIRGERAHPASDIYALGCLTYECAVGRPPFGDRSIAQACLAHLREPPNDPAQSRPDLPRPMTVALLKAMAKEPGERPRTAKAYARLLRAGAKAA